MKRVASKIVFKYISNEARLQVNLPYPIQQEILQAVEQADQIPLSPTLFARAQHEAMQLMGKDTFPRFLQSDQFKQFKSVCDSVTATNTPPPFSTDASCLPLHPPSDVDSDVHRENNDNDGDQQYVNEIKERNQTKGDDKKVTMRRRGSMLIDRFID